MQSGSNENVEESGQHDEYSVRLILVYEKFFGHNCLSLGGEDMITETASLLRLEAGQRVLDVGGGIGGPAFYMVKNFGVSVVCLDISANIALVGKERAKEAGFTPHQVAFETADVTEKEYAPESFDIIYSLFTVFYIEEKVPLFKKLYTFLKPGGKLLILDYCHSDGALSESFQTFLKEDIYRLVSLETYHRILADDTGFMNVKVMDRSLQFFKSFQQKLESIKASEEKILQEVPKTDYLRLVTRWTTVLQHLAAGYMQLNYFYAEKSK